MDLADMFILIKMLCGHKVLKKAAFLGRWGGRGYELVSLPRLFAMASLWVRIQASLKKFTMGDVSTRAANTLLTRQKNIQIYKVLVN
jgi:hypothetical protein